jgi:hypothetical protein
MILPKYQKALRVAMLESKKIAPQLKEKKKQTARKKQIATHPSRVTSATRD